MHAWLNTVGIMAGILTFVFAMFRLGWRGLKLLTQTLAAIETNTKALKGIDGTVGLLARRVSALETASTETKRAVVAKVDAVAQKVENGVDSENQPRREDSNDAQ